jgi:D-lactate dehydrogenase
MDVAVFSAKSYDRRFLDAASAGKHRLRYFEERLGPDTAALARDCAAVCLFVNDDASGDVLKQLAGEGARLIALRSAGFNHVNLTAAAALGLTVARVPAYSPHAVAEHTIALLLTLNRKTHRAYNRVREGNFALDGLLGFDLYRKTAGIIGTGKIGEVVARILIGFGCRVIANDPVESTACRRLGVDYVPLPELLSQADIVTLHCPLTPATHHLIGAEAIAAMKQDVILINTSRGAVVDARALVGGLKQRKIGGVALDVYEEEADLFFEDLSGRFIGDDVFARLLTFPNVLITGHQAFFTREAMTAIAETTIANITSFEASGRAVHEISTERVARSSA